MSPSCLFTWEPVPVLPCRLRPCPPIRCICAYPVLTILWSAEGLPLVPDRSSPVGGVLPRDPNWSVALLRPRWSTVCNLLVTPHCFSVPPCRAASFVHGFLWYLRRLLRPYSQSMRVCCLQPCMHADAARTCKRDCPHAPSRRSYVYYHPSQVAALPLRCNAQIE